jgi:hypothetical protein
MNNQNLTYFKLSPKTDNLVIEDPEWEKINRPKLCCSHCRHLLPTNRELPPVVVESGDFKTCFNSIRSNIRYYIVRDDLLEAFGLEVLPHVNLGKLLSQKGEEITRFQTLQPKRNVLIRGKPGSKDNGVCPVCGVHRYWPMPHGYGYVLRSYIADYPPIFRGTLGLCVNQAIHDRIIAGQFDRDIYIQTLAVLDEPLDGFPKDWQAYETPIDPHGMSVPPPESDEVRKTKMIAELAKKHNLPLDNKDKLDGKQNR